ncbi:MAG: hypothetical protein WCH99_14850 [Verrucomicrobiota bacterium]
MKIINTIQTLVQTFTRTLLSIRQRHPATCNQQPSTRPAIDLDELTDDGLLLREAIPVRSAEYWLQMGYPEMALKELQTLPESARRHPWTRRVSFDATVAQLHQATA